MKDAMRINTGPKPLSAEARANFNEIKEYIHKLQGLLENFPQNRELSLAKTKLEECVMWAVKGISG